VPPLPDALILVLAPGAPLVSARVWRYAPVWLLGAMRTPGPRTVTGALQVMGLAPERHGTHDQRVLNRATGSARHGSRMLCGGLSPLLVPLGATSGVGADDPVARRSGRKLAATGGHREAVRSTEKPVIRCVGLA
jgi:hypothetical protein